MISLALTLAQASNPLERMFFRNGGASELAHSTDAVFMAILWFCVFWFVLLMGLMVFWAVKYRRRPGVPAQRSPHHNTRLELIWTIVPSLFLGAMFYFGFQGYMNKLIAPTNAEVISIEGKKWQWTATYDNLANPPETTSLGGNNDAPIIYIPVGRPIQFRMTSTDVLHAFWIPDFRFKFDVMPNRYTSFWIQAEEEGDHWIFCAEYCGDKHSEMSAILRAVPASQYDTLKSSWSVDWTQPPEVLGQRFAKTNGCFGCHSVDGSPLIGPTWKNAWGYEVPLGDGTKIPADNPDAWDNYFRESVINPNAKIHNGFPPVMTNFAGVFSERELECLLAYHRSLSDKSQPAPQ